MLSLDPEVLDYTGAAEAHGLMLDALQPAPDLLVSQWADRHRVLSKKHAKESGAWSTDRVPYMREVMDFFSARSRGRRGVFIKGAQLGGTEAANNLVGYSISSSPAPILYVSPTLTVTKRTSARVQGMIDDDPEGLGKFVMQSRKRDSKNSQFEKHFPSGALYFATANSPSNLRSTAARITIFDEVDAYPADVGGEGGVVEVAEASGFTFGDQAKSFLISTPGEDHHSIIKPAYLKADQRLYMMPCPHCRRRIEYRWGQFAWHEGQPGTVVYKCQLCQGAIHEGLHKTRMLATGLWIPKVLRDDPAAMARIDRGDLSGLEAFNAEALYRSWHLPSFYSPVGWLAWSKIIRLWEDAQGQPNKLKSIVNTIFGETWVEHGEAPAWEAVYGRRTASYVQRQVPRKALFNSFGTFGYLAGRGFA